MKLSTIMKNIEDASEIVNNVAKEAEKKFTAIKKEVKELFDEIVKEEFEKKETKVEIDPYLVRGAICEIPRHDGSNTLMYFTYIDESSNDAYFVNTSDAVGVPGKEIHYKKYRVIGTVWDHAPDWANWYAVDEDRNASYYSKKPVMVVSDEEMCGYWDLEEANHLSVRASDDNRVENWEESLVQRPKWAKVK